jgi:hypothetical protein
MATIRYGKSVHLCTTFFYPKSTAVSEPKPISQTLLPLRLSNNEYARISCLSVRATHFSNLINPHLQAIPKFKKKTLR